MIDLLRPVLLARRSMGWYPLDALLAAALLALTIESARAAEYTAGDNTTTRRRCRGSSFHVTHTRRASSSNSPIGGCPRIPARWRTSRVRYRRVDVALLGWGDIPVLAGASTGWIQNDAPERRPSRSSRRARTAARHHRRRCHRRVRRRSRRGRATRWPARLSTRTRRLRVGDPASAIAHGYTMHLLNGWLPGRCPRSPL